jgi:inosose dehydratase
MTYNRRYFLGSLIGILGTLTFSKVSAFYNEAQNENLHVASNSYPWLTFYKRRNLDWNENLEESLKEFARSGIAGYEPAVNNPEEINSLAPLLKKYKLEMRSIYINSTLHDSDQSEKSINNALEIARAAIPLGLKIIVTNPSPISWGGNENKNDDQLRFQAKALNTLGAELQKIGITLAYHTHDIEMRNAAREFHHMLQNTDPQNVSFCLDVHWIFRGSGDSEVALFDVVKMYGKRIVELHLRQSKDGIWTEIFGEGDIDYNRLVKELKILNVKPHIVLEQAVEDKSPDTLDALEAHKKSLNYTKKLFTGWT